MVEEFPFKETFKKDGKEIVLACDVDGGMVQLINPKTGNRVNVNISWDGVIEIISGKAFPQSSLQITRVNIRHKGRYDEVELKANLKEE